MRWAILLAAMAGAGWAQGSGCESAKCHVGIEAMHGSTAVHLACTDCHGGRAETVDKLAGHVRPRNPALWPTAANPARTYALLNQESAEFVRFINPGDLRVADQTCGNRNCHGAIVAKVRSSMMSHGAFLWGAALYNNGGYPNKRPAFGESYGADGVAQKLTAAPPPSEAEMKLRAMLPELWPLPQFEATQPGNTLRVFERGDDRLSNRGFGTLTRTDPVFQGLQRTRLLDPLLYFLGTNDQPGDYRSSGCTACHVVYANDRDPAHSGPYAGRGHLGYSYTGDPTISKNQEGHPIQHRLTRSVPSSQCVVCHMHPGTSYASQYYGYMWWDNETDGDAMYPAKSKVWKPEDAVRSLARNPEAASLKGNWSDPGFLRNLSDLNPKNKQTQFADFNGHGWVYRAVYKHDRQGNWLDKDDHKVEFNDPKKFDKAVHLSDIHLDKGMQCVDCHFEQDSHGDGHLYGEPRAAVEIDCADCHGTVQARATLKTSNSAAPEGGNDLARLRTPFGTRRFEWVQGKLMQRSMVEDGKEWNVSQVLDSITPGSPNYNEKARLAKTIEKDGVTWGRAAAGTARLAHGDGRMSCYTCHTSWMTSCFGCHLSMKSNANRPALHFEGDVDTKNFTTYNFQVLRDDVFMLGLDSTAKKNRIAPVRSSSAVLVSSQNANREWIYHQEQTISAEGYSGQAFNPHYPHTVRTRETKTCTDCHVSRENDNNAWMAQLLLEGTNFVNFMGRYAYVGEGSRGFEAVAVTEHDEPQAVYGSYLQKLAYPEDYAGFARTRELKEAYEHGGNTLSLQLRGEYLYAAKGHDGVEVYDVANIDNKGFAERIISAPVSPLGQRFYVKTKDARWIASPTTLGVDPARRRNPENEEQPIHPLYAFLYVADAQEGLILINAATLLDGDPRNNFLKRAVTFNPGGVLNGANFVATAGNYAYVSCDRGLVIVSVEDPAKPSVVAEVPLRGAGHSAVQFRYAFVNSAEGVKIIDITDVKHAAVKASVEIADARDIYVARTWAYIAAGKQGMAMVDVTKPEHPGTPRFFNAGGAMNDTRAVRIGMTNASLFAYVADGKNGLRVLQLMAPNRTEGLWGFSPTPEPELIATYRTKGEAVALSKGLDRDRAVDESGNQLAVFGRRGARPFHLDEMQRLYLRDGRLYTVTDRPPSQAAGRVAMKLAVLWLMMQWFVAPPLRISTQAVNGIPRAVVLRASDGSAVDDTSPARPGEILIVRGSGFSRGMRLLVAGNALNPVVLDGGQAEFQLPSGVGGGFVEIEASMEGRGLSNTATLPAAAPVDAVQLSAADVQTLVNNAALVSDGVRLAVVVVDRAGRVLAIFRRAATTDGDVEKALSLARTGAFFSSVGTPLSSRTVRAISRPNFPEGIPNQPSGPLFGIENTNRGCDYNATFLPGQLVPRLVNATGSGDGAGMAAVAGGLPLFRDGITVVGGIGVAGLASDDVDEYAAAASAQASGFFVHLPLPDPGGVYLGGFLLPFINGAAPAGVHAASSANGSFQVAPLNGAPAPEGWLIGPKGSSTMSVAEVTQVVQNAIDTANLTRAQIRLPVGSRARMVISVSDLNGNVLALYRMADSPVFSIDVALTKARNVVYFSGAGRDLRDLPGVPLGTAVTNRTIGFASQPYFPSGIWNSSPGPFADMYAADSSNPCTQGHQAANLNQSGVVFFPGSAPLYRSGQLVGGLGVSGDGVDQDDFVTAGGAAGFLAPDAIRADQIFLRGVRLPDWSFPRNPEQ